ncbi:hypothetical protein [Salegentibacter sp. UBA1130]|uniref:hypothetical protein n=1 Tax=Salegentibacter sp. UBA1130 TaxID=1947451 RepID=UPI002580DF60|nr:hypothetical protein [Salegentibacter sp. UBA1130]
MKILFYFGHPAQYLFARATIKRLRNKPDFEVVILIKTKDVLENLLKTDGFPYKNILPQERGRSKFHIAWSLLKRNFKILPLLLKNRPDLMIGTDASIAQLGKLLNINCISITEDDYEVIKTLGDLTYPFSNTILCPEICKVGKWENKKTGYKGYMKLGYLHPNVFNPRFSVIEKYKLPAKYVILRLAKLTAHHDFGVKGIDSFFLDKMIFSIKDHGYLPLISSEDKIDKRFEDYLLRIEPSDMHHVLSFSSLLICDSQSMSVEAAMLGIPSIRYSDFAGRISVLEELEHKYALTFGFKVGREDDVLQKIQKLLVQKDLKEIFQKKKTELLSEKVDVTAFLEWFIRNYPESETIMKFNPEYQNKFIC